MMRKCLFLSWTILTTLKLFSQVNPFDYAASGVPEKLKKDANAVYRLDEGILEIRSAAKYAFTTRQVITLLNEEAAHHLNQTLYYNKFIRIDNVVFKIYNATGYLIRTYQKKDFNTRDYTDEISLYTDDKLLYLQAASPGYPCTIDITCERKANGYIALPEKIIAMPNEAVEYFSFIVKVPPLQQIKFRTLNSEAEPLLDSAGGTKTYQWIAKNVLASKPEADSYASYNLPKIEIVPDFFEYDGHKGELKSWQAFGAWNYQFYEDPKAFSKEEMENFQSLVSTCKTDKEKIKTLYHHLEQSMRYVSIQRGIGGFKPFPVKYVQEKKYGDCKALTNYMRYMLKAVGIKSYPALVNAGYNKNAADRYFPSDPFNHVILCVPLEKDSVWLECTSNNNDFGFLGSFTENKNALLLTENGGVLVPTPKSKYSNNILSTRSMITLNADGSSQVVSDVYSTGDFWNLFYEITRQPGEQQKYIFINYLHYKIPEEFKIDVKQNPGMAKQFSLTSSYDQQYDFKTGNKLFFKPRLSSLTDEEIQPTTGRKFDYLFSFPYEKTDTTMYFLPPDFTADRLPLKTELSNEYASYTNEYIKNESGTAISVIGKLCLKKCIIPPVDYFKVASFFQDVRRSENEKFILQKK